MSKLNIGISEHSQSDFTGILYKNSSIKQNKLPDTISPLQVN